MNDNRTPRAMNDNRTPRAVHVQTVYTFRPPLQAPEVKSADSRLVTILPETMRVVVYLHGPEDLTTWVSIEGRQVKKDGTIARGRRTVTFGPALQKHLPEWAYSALKDLGL